MIFLSNVFRGEDVVVANPSELPRVPVSIRSVPELSRAARSAPENTDVPARAPAPQGPTPEQAQAAAQSILAQAKETADAVCRSAYDKGLLKGEEEGRAAALAEERAAAGELRELCGRVTASRQKYEEKLYGEAVDFAFALAEKIVAAKIERDEDVFLGLCREAMPSAAGSQNAVLRVGERGYDVVVRNAEELQKLAHGLSHLEVVLDPDDATACRLESDGGLVDAGVRTRFKQAKKLAEPNG